MSRWLATLLLSFVAASSAQAQSAAPVAGRFDYYLLALSWSPSYCAQPEARRRDPLQCGGDRAFSFVVHGLWPQAEARPLGGPCRSTQPSDPPLAVARRMLDLMPSERLIQAQWDKHGTCSGLTPAAYFDLVRVMRAKVAIPPTYSALAAPMRVTAPQVEQAFLRANPGLRPDMLVVTCDERRIREVRVCLTKDGRFRACGPAVRERCGDRVFALPAARAAR